MITYNAPQRAVKRRVTGIHKAAVGCANPQCDWPFNQGTSILRMGEVYIRVIATQMSRSPDEFFHCRNLQSKIKAVLVGLIGTRV